jgi:hypothetical protein
VGVKPWEYAVLCPPLLTKIVTPARRRLSLTLLYSSLRAEHARVRRHQQNETTSDRRRVGFFTSFCTLTRQSTPLLFLPLPLTLVSGTGGAPLFATRHCIRSRRCNRARRRHEPTTSTFSPSSPSSSGLCLPESRRSALFHSTAAKDPAWSCSAALNYHKLPPDARRWSTVTDTGLCRWFCPSLCPVIYSHSLNPKCSHA